MRITPLLLDLAAADVTGTTPGCAHVAEGNAGLWYDAREPARIGLPAPMDVPLAALPDIPP